MLKKRLSRCVLLAAATALLLAGLPACSDDDGDGGGMGEVPSEPFTGKIYIVGDSTVCSFNDNYYLPRYGYGTQISKYINVADENVENLALSGRSSKSFLAEENYTTFKTPSLLATTSSSVSVTTTRRVLRRNATPTRTARILRRRRRTAIHSRMCFMRST